LIQNSADHGRVICDEGVLLVDVSLEHGAAATLGLGPGVVGAARGLAANADAVLGRSLIKLMKYLK
jgi:hypothetical protein